MNGAGQPPSTYQLCGEIRLSRELSLRELGRLWQGVGPAGRDWLVRGRAQAPSSSIVPAAGLGTEASGAALRALVANLPRGVAAAGSIRWVGAFGSTGTWP